MKWKLTILICFWLSLSAFSQDRKLDRLELLFQQENYDITAKYSQKLIDKKGYENHPMPYLFKALSLSKMKEEQWHIRKKFRPVDEHINKSLIDFKALDNNEVYASKYENLIYKTHQGSKAIDPNNTTKAVLVASTSKKTINTFDESEKIDLKISDKRTYLTEISKVYLGTPYKYGGTSKAEGFDCSGFSCEIMKEVGVELPRTSSEQGKVAEKINLKDAKKGDLLFFGRNNNNIHHVGIVISDENEPLTMIHASTSSGVIITNLETSEYWSKRLLYAGRVIND